MDGTCEETEVPLSDGKNKVGMPPWRLGIPTLVKLSMWIQVG